MSAQVYLNGRILPLAEAHIIPSDRGFLYGDGFFETTRIVGGAPLLWDRHLDRLSASCRETGFGAEIDEEELTAGVKGVIAANGVCDGYLRVTVSRGAHAGRLEELAAKSPTVLAEARPMALPPLHAPPAWALAKSPYRRDESSPLVRHKSLSYQLNVLALAEGRQRGADEVFFLNSRGRLTEGTVTNLFFVKGGAAATPDVSCGLLPGITRQVVLDLCRQEGIAAEVGEYDESDLKAADEIFCTNSLRGIVAVDRVLEWPDARFACHSVTRSLQDAYARLVRRLCGAEAD